MITDRARRRIRVEGVVQGVGFRPFVYVLATELALGGHVGNDSAGVFIEVEGSAEVVEEFERRLIADAPPLSRIESVSAEAAEPSGEQLFSIVASRTSPGGVTLVSPDLAPCAACEAELADPSDGRFRYPFLNCTNCGPRFTITVDVPYDRPSTTMAGFEMCARCRSEYEDPTDRRFHAQPTACPACGPRTWLEAADGTIIDTPDPIGYTQELIARGSIVAVRGVGGYHLACRADRDAPVQELRRRKGRSDKPFALMVADLVTAGTIAHVEPAGARLLEGPERPIVLLRERESSVVSDQVAPGNGYLGIMLPSSPLHRLLVEPGSVWVMTSGNRAQEPICIDVDEARRRLSGLADHFLHHDRPIHVPCDDSVVRVLPAATGGDAWLLPVRRSRGYAPYPVAVDFGGPPVLAVGGELKATFCLTRGDQAFMGQHIGDMENLETLAAFERAVSHMTTLFRTEPEVLACDLHPRYLSSRWAHDHAVGRPVVEVQHHHAHVASLLAEHRRSGPVLGFSFDGTGFGSDGTIWGGEVLVCDLERFERVGHLATSRLAGGDAAVRRPYRQALTRLREAEVEWEPDLAPVGAATDEERRVLTSQLDRGLNVVETSSMGRLFDAVASMCGVCHHAGYEGQAAIELEAVATRYLEEQGDSRPPGFGIDIGSDGRWETNRLVRDIVERIRAGDPPGPVAAGFHTAVAEAMVEASRRIRAERGLGVVGLSGGVFQNATLLGMVAPMLSGAGFEVLTHRVVPPNDGGLALGQAAVAASTAAT